MLNRAPPGEDEFHQAVHEVFSSIWEFLQDCPQYIHAGIPDRMVEPERVIMFRVPWRDDRGMTQINRGYRVEFNSAIGPYKGGLRFHASVNLSILKFLGFEQVFKNSLTTLPMGGGKGGSDFDPKGKSDNEVMSFTQSFMSELFRHIGPDTDVPAGDIGVGGREIGYLFGQYKRLRNEFSGVLTGKGLNWGGSLIRPEATGYGTVYFAEEMLKLKDDSFSGKTVTISGSGNVAQFAAEKVIQLDGKVVSISDSNGTIHDSDGIDAEKLAWVMDLKKKKRGRIKDYSEKFGCEYLEGKRPWSIPCDIALPCATQNEINEKDAKILLRMAANVFQKEPICLPIQAQLMYLLQTKYYSVREKRRMRGSSSIWIRNEPKQYTLVLDKEEVDQRLHQIMKDIHKQCNTYGQKGDYVNYIKGANIGGFIKVADAMIDQGVVYYIPLVSCSFMALAQGLLV
ncbi:MAG: glutamate dehydrogenase [Candidatus Neomarinimicrobiota bacterium]|nr:MAG: glutamate dehydrogenase [Candidatus Neomarinimicrobiota bacterium]